MTAQAGEQIKVAARSRAIVPLMHACSLAALAALTALAFNAPAAAAGDTATANATANATAHAAPVRAITLTPHITELIFAAGAGDRIVATVTSSDYPATALAIPRIGDGVNISIEKALSFRPDLVVAWQASAAAVTLAPAMARLHIPLLYSAPRSLADIPGEVRRFGALFETQGIAETAAQELSIRLQGLETRYAGRERVAVFMEIGANPVYTLGNDPLLNDALRICGAHNVYADAFIAAPQVSAESVLVAQPAVIITSAIDHEALQAATARWAALRLPAALKGHVYGIDPDKLFRPGPRLIDAVEELCRYIDKSR
ncbi:cobalamin-binding protein [Pollutimonas nitritireducens]|uniref:cobalamin-binding protein n=1 Tax=Pollutimonas nitritireducens TaxID=2045209 RepID=UPI0013044D8D|nr:cobalamin-binding protein [Pollutimonas nitritireducens]